MYKIRILIYTILFCCFFSVDVYAVNNNKNSTTSPGKLWSLLNDDNKDVFLIGMRAGLFATDILYHDITQRIIDEFKKKNIDNSNLDAEMFIVSFRTIHKIVDDQLSFIKNRDIIKIMNEIYELDKNRNIDFSVAIWLSILYLSGGVDYKDFRIAIDLAADNANK